MEQRQAVTKKKALTHRGADRSGKSRILASWLSCSAGIATTPERRCGMRLTLKIVKPRRGRAQAYGPRVTVALTKCWAELRAPTLAALVPLLSGNGDRPRGRGALLERMSATAIDHRLEPERLNMEQRGRSLTKPGAS